MSAPIELYRPAKRKSEVWEFFGYRKDATGRLVEDRHPICKTCGRRIAAKGGNTTNLMSHLRDRHPELFRRMKCKQYENQCHNLQDLQVPLQVPPQPKPTKPEPPAKLVQFRTKILALMESLMVKTTSEIVSIFDHIYMDTENELMKTRKQVETLTQRLEEREQPCAPNAHQDQHRPSDQVGEQQEPLHNALAHRQPAPEKTEAMELSLACTMVKVENQVNMEPAVQPYEYQIMLSSVTDEQQELLTSPVRSAEAAGDRQPHQMNLRARAATTTAEQHHSEWEEEEDEEEEEEEEEMEDSIEDPDFCPTSESDQADLPPLPQQHGRPPECLESLGAPNNPSGVRPSVQFDDLLNSMNGGLLGDQVESAEKQLSLVQQPPQMNLQTTASAGPEELSSSMSLEPSAAAVQDIEASAVPESDQAASPVARRRGRSAGWTPSPSSSPNLPLRSCTATSSTQSGAEDTSEKLDTSFAIVDARSLQQKPADSVAEETPNDLLPEGGIKGGSSDMKSKADERTDLQGEDDVSRRSFELTSEEIPRKRRRVIEAECKHDVNGALHPVEKIIKKRTAEDGEKEVRVKWLPCSSCGAKWRNSWEPA
ncbi:histone H3.v1 isoform X2 [Engraulis encrasicolus]|uniref:histone H3.v1 isoform X2 n=1 Tax=Engraulis encrasicolus TaxID=184585 RepID=UPI002FCF0CDE